MSDLDSKLEVRRPSAGGKAQAHRKQLLSRWGSREVDRDTITIDSMGRHEEWRRIGDDVFVQESTCAA